MTYLYGHQSEEIRVMQKALLDHGFDVGKDGADGGFGDDTLKAVKDAQAAFKLPVNGVVDQSLLDAIGIAPPPPSRSRLTPNPVVQAIGSFALNVIINQLTKGLIPMNFLSGYKTYGVAVIMIILAIAGLFGWVIPGVNSDPGTLILGAIGLITGRVATAKVASGN